LSLCAESLKLSVNLCSSRGKKLLSCVSCKFCQKSFICKIRSIWYKKLLKSLQQMEWMKRMY